MRLTTLRKDEGSLPMAMLIVTVVLSISAALVPVVVRQTKATQNIAERTTTLDSAQAGMDVMMARVRAAADLTTHDGYLENMPPCTLGGDAGVNATTERLAYQVTVTYYDSDGAAMTCPVTNVPTTAKVVSIGTVGNVKRTLTATYVFSTSNTNIPGGQIRIASSTLGNQCLDYSGTAKPPTAGTAIIMATCDNSSRQQFGYTTDLYLKLIGSEQNGADDGMCLYAGATHASGNGLVFQPCPATTPATSTYQWSLDGSSLFHSANSSKAVESFCINVTKPGVAASPVALGGCSTDTTKTVWRSAPGVGAGMAGDSTNQLVNYAQFSRCLDVTSKSTSATYMIAWFCKQAPNGVVDFNQQWVHPTPGPKDVSATGPIIVNNYTATSNSNSACATSSAAGCANNYCLKSPGTVTASSWVTVESCKTAAVQATTAYQWTVYHDTGDYATSYRIKDYKGNCLQPTRQTDTSYTAPSTDLHSDGTSKVKVATCSSSELQKWNAPANISKPTPLTDLTED
ncbi:ricin-type beta-trefoil lectin domain protein [Actinoplanes sp. HUAS TT8]|uniref:ricin-type beta-trefoil lectin domain protein n=1 Tax=Actinoplanes sp. HUAS TT8 TaxID=3447453 RepID=UPI003F524420